MSSERPGILTAIAIIGIVLGSLGLVGALLGAAGTVVQDLTSLEAAGQAQQAQLEIAKQMNEIAREYRVPTVVAAVANFVVSALLIVGGALLLGRKPVARGLMTVAVVAAIVVDGFSAALGIYIQIEVAPLSQEMMRSLAADTNMPPGADAAMDSVLSAMAWVGWAMAAFWLLCKVAYYVVTFVALKRPTVKDWIAEGVAA